VLLTACTSNDNKPDVSDIKVDVQIERFESNFFKIDTANVQQGLAHLRNAFPSFYGMYLQNILGVNPVDPASLEIIRSIVNTYRSINDSIQKKYSKLDWLEEELEGGFKYVKYYYPNYKVPKVITFIGTLDAPGMVLTPDYLGIGLHQFGGKNFSVYQDPQVQQMYPAYISRRFDKEYITANAMKAIADDIYPDKSTGRPLIEQMIEKGKSWYLMDHFLPDAPDSVKTGFTQKQLDWAVENEGAAWAFITKQENLYSIEPHVIQTYIGEAPFTQNMPESSPGNLGQWIGWRIIQQYAERNEKLSLQEILAASPRTIFEGSKYRPK
jgi:hypothetical protein